MGSSRDSPGLRTRAEKRFACRQFSGIENRAGASAGARFSPRLSLAFLTKIAVELSMASLASFWGALGGSLGLTSGAPSGCSVSLGVLLGFF